MTKIDLTTDIKPICPHCEKEINSLYFVKLGEITISGESLYVSACFLIVFIKVCG